MAINMQLSESIFLTAIGLIASGYDLYNKENSDVLELVEIIKAEYKDQEVINYFKAARTETCTVNPYWPRGSAVYAASLFLTSNYESIDLDGYLCFEKQSNASASWQDKNFIAWIKQLPYFFKIINEHPRTQMVIELIKSYIKKHDIEFKLELNKAKEIMDEFKADSEFQVIYLPNLLQAEQCTDYIKKENTLYVVARKPRFSSMVHEYLHLSFEAYRSYMADLYKSYKGTPLFHKNKLSDLGYMWDEDLDSELRGLEEGFVRSITILISTLTDEEKKIELAVLREEGFTLADKLISYVDVKVKEENFKEIIKFVFKY